jgi:hypothetical protein
MVFKDIKNVTVYIPEPNPASWGMPTTFEQAIEFDCKISVTQFLKIRREIQKPVSKRKEIHKIKHGNGYVILKEISHYNNYSIRSKRITINAVVKEFTGKVRVN